MRLITPLAAVVVALVMAAPATAVNIPEPPTTQVVPHPGHTLSKAKKKCAKKKNRKARKKCKRRYRYTPPHATTESRHWFRDADGNGTVDLSFDTDGDGVYESTFFDFNQDGYYEAFFTTGVYGTAAAIDSNQDTYYEYITLDPGSDGWWDLAYIDLNADRVFDQVGYDVNPVDNIMDSWYTLAQQVNSPLVNENIITMNLIRTQDPWAHQDPWGTWGGDASNNPLY